MLADDVKVLLLERPLRFKSGAARIADFLFSEGPVTRLAIRYRCLMEDLPLCYYAATSCVHSNFLVEVPHDM